MAKLDGEQQLSRRKAVGRMGTGNRTLEHWRSLQFTAFNPTRSSLSSFMVAPLNAKHEHAAGIIPARSASAAASSRFTHSEACLELEGTRLQHWTAAAEVFHHGDVCQRATD